MSTTTMSSMNPAMMDENELAVSILNNDLMTLERLLKENGASVNEPIAPTYSTPLLLAVGPEPIHTRMVQILLEYGANVQVGESFHQVTPLMAACNVENYDIVLLFLHGGANINVRSVDGKTALIQTARIGNLNVFQLLLEWGADKSLYDEQAKNALMYACSENRISIVQYLMTPQEQQQQSTSSSPIDLSITTGVNDYKVDTALWYAAASGHVEIVQLLLDGGAWIEYRQDGTIYSTTPLMEACEWGHVDVVETLLYYGAQVDNLTGRKAMNLARRSGYHDVVSVLEKWEKRLKNLIDRFVKQPEEGSAIEDATIPANLLPTILERPGRRPDLIYQILRRRMDILISEGSTL